MKRSNIYALIIAAMLSQGCTTTETIEFNSKASKIINSEEKNEATIIGNNEEVIGEGNNEDVVVKNERAQENNTENGNVYVVEKIIYIERPIYYPINTYKAPTGEEAVKRANEVSAMTPEVYDGRIMIYDYDETITYEIYCQPFRTTDIYLQEGEILIDTPFMGDSSRWQIGYNKSVGKEGEVQHIYLKPDFAGLETTMIVNTTKRIYYLIIKSYADVYMSGVRWRYVSDEMPNYIIPIPKEKIEVNTEEIGQEEKQKNAITILINKYDINPNNISQDYTMKYPGGTNKPVWLPVIVFDDGKKTYVYLPENIAYHEMPALFMQNEEIVNYRIDNNIIIIDRLVEKITLRLRKIEVEIAKNRGGA